MPLRLHAIVSAENAASQRHQLALSRMIDSLDPETRLAIAGCARVR
jgi:hypothetical protein